MKTFLLALFLFVTIIHNSFGQYQQLIGITITVDGNPKVFECIAMDKLYDRYQGDSIVGKYYYIVIAGWAGKPKYSDFITFSIPGNDSDGSIIKSNVKRLDFRYSKYMANTKGDIHSDPGNVVYYDSQFDTSDTKYTIITDIDSSRIKGAFGGQIGLMGPGQYNIKRTMYICGVFNLPIYYKVDGEYISKEKKIFQL